MSIKPGYSSVRRPPASGGGVVVSGTASDAMTRGRASESSRLVYHRPNVISGRATAGSWGNYKSGRVSAVGRTTTSNDSDFLNPVDDCMNLGAAGFGWCMLLWVFGCLSLLLNFARQSDYDEGNSTSTRSSGFRWGIFHVQDSDGPPWLAFAPFWLGDIVGFAFLVRLICKVAGVRLAGPTRRGTRRYGTREDSGGASGDLRLVNVDYFPLLQRVVVTWISSLLLLITLTVEQVLVCLQWGGGSEAPGSLAVATPLLIIEFCCLLRVVLIRYHGWFSGLTCLLLLLLTLLVALRSNPTAPFLEDVPWLECLAPLWALNLLFLAAAGYLLANICLRRYLLTRVQTVCFTLYCISLVASIFAQVLLIGDERLGVSDLEVQIFRLDLPLLLGLFALTVFCLASYLSVEHTISRLIISHGYEDPVPLSKTVSGWEWSGAGTTRWGLLGDISLRAGPRVKTKPVSSRLLG
ncbi:unnamed protein product [Choristocarpus tenellus]